MKIRKLILGVLVLSLWIGLGSTETMALSDLVVTYLEGPTPMVVQTGGTLANLVTVRNQGTTSSGPFRLGLYLSTNSTITTTDTWVGISNYPSLAPSEEVTAGGNLPLPPSVQPGTYYFGAIADDLGAVAESNEGNNTRTANNGTLLVTSGGPETISTPSTPTGPANGTVGNSYPYATGGAISSTGDSVQYYFDWGNGTNSGWLPVGTTTASKTWGSSGTFKVKVRARCSTHTSILSSWSGEFTVTLSTATLPMVGVLENPPDGKTISGITTIHGWAIDGKEITKVEFFIDGGLAGEIPYGGSRMDVQGAYPAYPDADKSGFGVVFNFSILSAGPHTIKVRTYNLDGDHQDHDATVTVKKFHGAFMDGMSPGSRTLTNNNVTTGSDTRNYDIKIEWSNGTQGFEITDIILHP